MELKELEISTITKDERTQPRAVIDEHTVNEYRLDMLEGDKFPPLMVFKENGYYYLADGWHRLRAAEQVGLETIECAIKPGTLREAILYSCSVNADHGKRRSNGDKRRAVMKLLKDPDWSKWSDAEIARKCKVDHKTVGKYRSSLGNSQVKEKKYTTKHGTTAVMNTENIGKSNGDQQDQPREYEHTPQVELFSDVTEEEVEAAPRYDPLNYELFVSPIHNIANHVMPDSVDAIITDPPYPKEYIHTYFELAEQAAIVLKPGGILVAMAGHPYIETLVNGMSKHLHYHWLGCYYMPTGQHASLPYYSVSVYWKPLLIFSKGNWPKTRTFKDVIVNDEADKKFHEWGQGITGFKRIIEAFTLPNETVLDPFVGGGTTAIAALESGRYFIGSDISSEEVEKTRGRLNDVS